MEKFTDCEWNRDGFRVSTDPTLLDLDVIHEYLTHSYWSPGIGRDLVERAAQNSLCFGVYAVADDMLTQVGFARAVTDFARFAYLADVFILDAYQGRGLGTWMMDCIMSCPAFDEVNSFLLLTQDAHELYRKVGFEIPDEHRKIMVHRSDAEWYEPKQIRKHPKPPWEKV